MTSNQPIPSETTRPAARPAAPNSDAASAPVSGLSQPTGATKVSPLAVTPEPSSRAQPPTPRSRLGRARRRQLAEELTDRDRLLLSSLDAHRFLTTHQLQQFLFAPDLTDATARATRRIVTRLQRHHLIQPVAPRRVGGLRGGASATTWRLTSGGHAVLTGLTSRLRTSEPSTRFLAHRLAIADAHLAGLAAATALNGTLDVQIEKHATRTYTGIGGSALRLAPDLAFTLAAHDSNGPYEDRWFIEVDLGSESLPTLIRKAERYEAHYRSGTEQFRSGTFPLILWRFHGRAADARARQLKQQIDRAGRLTAALHRYAAYDQAMHHLLVTGGAE